MNNINKKFNFKESKSNCEIKSNIEQIERQPQQSYKLSKPNPLHRISPTTPLEDYVLLSHFSTYQLT